MRGRRRIGLVASAAAGIALLAGCNGSFQGGGAMSGANGGKAQVQFRVLCNTKTQRVSGQLIYMDSSVGLLLLGVPTSYPSGEELPGLKVRTRTSLDSEDDFACDNDAEGGIYNGSYISLSPRGTGNFEFGLVYDSEDCTTGPGYLAGIEITSGPAEGYENYSCLTTGSITPINN